jgi:uncharacterized membrane protein YdjX (TVP38/TMEM64 family)
MLAWPLPTKGDDCSARWLFRAECTLPASKKRDWITITIFGVIVVALIIVGATSDVLSLDRLGHLVSRVRDSKFTLAIFVLLSIGVAAVGLPVTPMQLMGGALFGIWRGIALNWGTAVVGGILGFYLARAVGKNTLKRLVERMAHRTVKFSGPRARMRLFRLRLLPLTPFGAINFAAGLAGMKLWEFTVATAVGILPSVAVVTYFASQVLGGGAKARHTAIVHTLIAAGVLWVLSYTPRLWDKLHPQNGEETE